MSLRGGPAEKDLESERTALGSHSTQRRSDNKKVAVTFMITSAGRGLGSKFKATIMCVAVSNGVGGFRRLKFNYEINVFTTVETDINHLQLNKTIISHC